MQNWQKCIEKIRRENFADHNRNVNFEIGLRPSEFKFAAVFDLSSLILIVKFFFMTYTATIRAFFERLVTENVYNTLY